MYGTFNCPFCTDWQLVEADTEHEHNGMCGDHVWADELPSFPIELRSEVGEGVRELVAEETGCTLPDDTTLADMVFALIEIKPEEGRALLAKILTDETWWWPTCECCGRRGQLLTPLVPLAA